MVAAATHLHGSTPRHVGARTSGDNSVSVSKDVEKGVGGAGLDLLQLVGADLLVNP